jgi:hypothetical protein
MTRHLRGVVNPKAPQCSRDEETLFSGIWIRWSQLTRSEQVVCLLICLIPLWWLWGWKHFFILLAFGLFGYDYWRDRELWLPVPSVCVISGLTFSVYTLLSRYFYEAFTGGSLSPNAILSALNSWAGPALILWYIQSRHIRVRWTVIAWSFSTIIIWMLLFWAMIFFVWKQGTYDPPRSVYGFLTSKPLIYIPGAGNSNYLIPYFHNDEALIPGMVRYVYFFPGPESLGLTLGFISLIALDLKNKVWSVALFTAAIFILLTSGTRSVTLVLPLVYSLRFVLTTWKIFGAWLVCALIATLTFSILLLPPVTDLVFGQLNDTAEAAGEARADSTEVRGEIYRLTIEGIMEASNTEFFFGYVNAGPGVLPGYEPARVGTHSLILGTMLYRAGIVGTLIFAIHWISFIWLAWKDYRTKPLAFILIFVIFSLTFMVMEIELPVMPIALLSVIAYKQEKEVDKIGFHGLQF